MQQPTPEGESSPSPHTIPQRVSSRRGKWSFVAWWVVVQGLVNLLIFWGLPEVRRFLFDASRFYEARTFRFSDALGQPATMPYRLMRPKQAEGKFPLLVFLHGSGERGSDNLAQLRFLPERMTARKLRKRSPCFLLAPQCAENRAWVMDDQLTATISLIEQTLRNEPSIDRQRVYLTGLSMGGGGVWQIAARRPDLFAAVVPVCGVGDPQQAGALASLPIWAVHGTEDATIPVRHSHEMIAAITAKGGHPQLTELEGVGHDSWSYTYDPANGIIDWMFAQVRSVSASPPAVPTP